jgi:post-segregation antitoxin (ccd killing protein)
MGCYWAQPESYKHVAMRDVRRLDVVWTDQDVEVYDELRQRARDAGLPMSEYVKDTLRRVL